MALSGHISTEVIFDRLPVGVGAFDEAGALVDANPAFTRLVPAGDQPGVRCCELFGCHADGPLRNGCLTELARRGAVPLPEVRLDVGREDDRRSIWVLASGAGSGIVLVHVRPGSLDDRRRRTVPHWTSGPRLVIRMLGPTVVSSAEGSLSGAWLTQRPGELLKLLVCRRRELPHREELAAALWPDAGTAAALVSLRYTVFHLRRRLEPARVGNGSFVTTVQDGYRLELGRIDLDVDAFERLLRRAAEARVRGAHDAAREHLHRAMDLYAGPFLADEGYAEWAFAERDRLHGLAREALDEVATLDEEAGDLRSVIAVLRRLTELEPLDLPAQKRLLALLEAAGRHQEADQRRQALRERWWRAYGEPVGF